MCTSRYKEPGNKPYKVYADVYTGMRTRETRQLDTDVTCMATDVVAIIIIMIIVSLVVMAERT